MNKILVNYSSSDDSSEDEIQNSQHLKRIKLENSNKLKLPNYLKTIIPPVDTNEYDDPHKHMGRVRSFPHERGNWTTYVYSKGPINDSIELLCGELKLFLENQISGLVINHIEDYHVSLTRTVVLRHHWIESFTKSIRELMSNVKRFHFKFNSLQIYCNDEQTRTFIGLSVDKDTSEYLENAVKILNGVLVDFKLPKFYKNPSFHMSILWCLGNQKLQLEQYLDEINKIFMKIQNEYNEDDPNGSSNGDFFFYVIELFCKIGNKLFTFDLS